jgi:hypothetical protein
MQWRAFLAEWANLAEAIEFARRYVVGRTDQPRVINALHQHS